MTDYEPGHCKHGVRRRVVGGKLASDLRAGEHCPANDPACGVIWVGIMQLAAYWAASGPPSDKAAIDDPSLSGLVSGNAASVYPLPDPSELPPAPLRYVPQRYR